MKLYYSTGACSLAPHIILREIGLDFSLELVNLRTGQYKGKSFREKNPKGYVPVLELNNGEILTEGAVILQYLADYKPEKNLLPKTGSMERFRCLEWLNYIATEIHKGFSPLFSDGPEVEKNKAKEQLAQRLEFVNRHLSGQKFLMGEQFTVADAYLFTVVNWSNYVKLDISPWKALQAFQEEMRNRPSVQEAMKAESLK